LSRSHAIFGVAWALAAVAACGGAEVTDLFGGSATPSTDDAGPGDLDSATTDDGAPADPDGSVTRQDSGGKSDGGNPQGDAFVPVDAGKSDALLGLDPGISCGSGTVGEINCATTLQYCCATPNGASVNFDCKLSTVSACAGLRIVCDDSADCPGNQFCCGTYEQNVGYTKVDCRGNAACGATTATTSFVRFCDPKASPDECAGVGKTCSQQSTTLPGYYYCK
jgi:hypothetical protein